MRNLSVFEDILYGYNKHLICLGGFLTKLPIRRPHLSSCRVCLYRKQRRRRLVAVVQGYLHDTLCRDVPWLSTSASREVQKDDVLLPVNWHRQGGANRLHLRGSLTDD